MTTAYTHTTARDIYRLAAAGLVPRPAGSCVALPAQLQGGIRAIPKADLGWTHISAARLQQACVYQRSNKNGKVWYQSLPALAAIPEAPPNAEEYEVTMPLKTLVYSCSDIRRGKRAVSTAEPSLRGAGVFRRFLGTQYVVCAELLFVSMAGVFKSEWELAAFGCELCGWYSLLPQGLCSLAKVFAEKRGKPLTVSDIERGDGYVERPPLTTPTRIRAFLQENPQLRGVAKARSALRWVTSGSRSPMETASSLLLCITQKLGGFGLGKVKLNQKVQIKKKWQRVLGKPYLVVDEVLDGRNGNKMVVEYQGWEWHTGRWRMTQDNRRRLALEDAGYEVIFVTWDDFCQLEVMSQISDRIARRLKRWRGTPSSETLKRRQMLHRKLCDVDFGR